VIVADTDVLIDVLRGREPAATRVASAITEGTLATTTVSAFELRSGARTAKEAAAVEALLGGLSILPFDDRASQAAAACRRALEPEGRTIGMGDYLIAGICISRASVLLTRNRRHFERIQRLAVDSP
jgi:predicted nucleic acid-binding protein